MGDITNNTNGLRLKMSLGFFTGKSFFAKTAYCGTKTIGWVFQNYCQY
jgi:hypothetical protein